MNNWPKGFPCPLIEGHGAEAYAAVLRTPFQGGNTRQRRIHRQLPHALSLSWMFKQSDYGLVLKWLNLNAWDWFTINLPGPLAGLHNVDTYPHAIRFISDLNAQLIRGAHGYYWKVSVTAEWNPNESDFGPGGGGDDGSDIWVIAGALILPSTDWIIAGTPFAPSVDVYAAGSPSAGSQNAGWGSAGTPGAPSADWIIAGTPPVPSADVHTAGSPQTPAALV